MQNSIKTGTSAIVNQSTINKSRLASNSDANSFNARVIDCYLIDSQNESFFRDFPESNYYPIGTIKFERVHSDVLSNGKYYLAIPLDIHNFTGPQINEIVSIVPNANYNAQTKKGAYNVSYYYTNAISIWDSMEHNIVPDVTENSNVPSVQNYKNTQTGITKTTQNENPAVIQEKGDIKNLYKLTDNVTSGRYGNSIRMGSSNPGITEIPWKGNYGDPIIVIRNGQRQVSGSVTNIFEDINQDGSSFYMMSTQTINFNPGNNNFESFDQDVTFNSNNYIESKKVVNTSQSVSPSLVDISVSVTDVAPTASPVFNATNATQSIVENDIIFLPSNENDFIQEFKNDIITDAKTDDYNVSEISDSYVPSSVIPSSPDYNVFLLTFSNIRAYEGKGPENDRRDTGGPTNQGITLKEFTRNYKLWFPDSYKSGITAQKRWESLTYKDVQYITYNSYWIFRNIHKITHPALKILACHSFFLGGGIGALLDGKANGARIERLNLEISKAQNSNSLNQFILQCMFNYGAYLSSCPTAIYYMNGWLNRLGIFKTNRGNTLYSGNTTYVVNDPRITLYKLLINNNLLQVNSNSFSTVTFKKNVPTNQQLIQVNSR